MYVYYEQWRVRFSVNHLNFAWFPTIYRLIQNTENREAHKFYGVLFRFLYGPFWTFKDIATMNLCCIEINGMKILQKLPFPIGKKKQKKQHSCLEQHERVLVMTIFFFGTIICLTFMHSNWQIYFSPNHTYHGPRKPFKICLFQTFKLNWNDWNESVITRKQF